MSERTQESYTRGVRQLVNFYSKTPDLVSEKELQDYFLHRKNIDKWSAATMRICYSGIKFFFINVLKRDWHTLALIHAKREQRLPTVLSVDEVRTILGTVSTPQNKAYLTTVYSCGLRLHEALCAVPLDKISALIELAFGFEIVTPKAIVEPPKPLTCSKCGGTLLYRASVLPFKIILSGSG